MKSILNILLCFLFVCETFSSFSNSHTSISLRTLIPNSDLIIVGKVISTKEITKPNNQIIYDFNKWEAKVEVLEVLKGNRSSYFNKVISIGYTKNIPCTGSAEYLDSLFVLSFLSVSETGELYTIHGPYGVKNLDKNGINAYIERIKEFNELGGVKMDSSKLVNWYINCVSHPATSWEGAFELSPEVFFIIGKDSIGKKMKLSNQQIKNLRNNILNIEYIDYQDIALLPLVYSHGDSELIRYLANQIDTVNYEKRGIISERIIAMMTSLVNNYKIDKISQSYENAIDKYLASNYHDNYEVNHMILQQASIEIYKKFQKTLIELSYEKTEEEEKGEITFQSKNNYYREIGITLLIMGLLVFLLMNNFKKKNK